MRKKGYGVSTLKVTRKCPFPLFLLHALAMERVSNVLLWALGLQTLIRMVILHLTKCKYIFNIQLIQQI